MCGLWEAKMEGVGNDLRAEKAAKAAQGVQGGGGESGRAGGGCGDGGQAGWARLLVLLRVCCWSVHRVCARSDWDCTVTAKTSGAGSVSELRLGSG